MLRQVLQAEVDEGTTYPHDRISITEYTFEVSVNSFLCIPSGKSLFSRELQTADLGLADHLTKLLTGQGFLLPLVVSWQRKEMTLKTW